MIVRVSRDGKALSVEGGRITTCVCTVLPYVCTVIEVGTVRTVCVDEIHRDSILE